MFELRKCYCDLIKIKDKKTTKVTSKLNEPKQRRKMFKYVFFLLDYYAVTVIPYDVY